MFQHKGIIMVVKLLGNGKSAGANNITAEMIKAGGEHIIDILATICKQNMVNKALGKIVDTITGDHHSQKGISSTMSELQNHQSHINMQVKLSSKYCSIENSQKSKPFL